jgi:hypothetical protein
VAVYEVQRPMQYHLHGFTSGMLNLQRGDVVQGVTLGSLPPAEAEPLRRVEKRAQGTQVRLLFFRAMGVVRYAHAVQDLMPTRRRPTIPTEATDGR